MTIKIDGYPGTYKRIHSWLREFLQLQLDVPPAVIDQLHEWARYRENETRSEAPRRFATWEAAASAAAAQIDMAEMADEPDRRDIADLVYYATRIVQNLMVLTGSWRSTDITRVSREVAEDASDLRRIARRVPHATRIGLGVDDMAALLKESRSTRQLEYWQPPLVLELVKNPTLVFSLPEVRVAAQSEELTKSLLVKLKSVERVSASAKLKTTIPVGDEEVPVAATFTTNSGSKELIAFTYSVPHPTERDATQEVTEHLRYGGEGTGALDITYKSFAVTADASEKEATTRAYDADKKLFDAAHDLLVRSCKELDVGLHEATGTFEMVTGIKMCASCYMVALQFLTNFPNVRVIIRRQLQA